MTASISNCVDCGARSIAQIADHICEECEDLYVLCVECVDLKTGCAWKKLRDERYE